MTPDNFIDQLRAVVFDAAVEDTMGDLSAPAGRRPSPSLVAASQWFNRLPGADRAFVRQIARDAAHAAIFGFLAVLDGARAFDPQRGELLLTYVGPDGAGERLNQPTVSELHALWTSTVPAYDSDAPP